MGGLSPILRLVFRLSLFAHERVARARFGAEMERLWRADVEGARGRGAGRAVWVALRGAWDVGASGLRERFRGGPDDWNAEATGERPRKAVTMMSHLGQDIRFAFRSLARQPGFTFVAVLTLGMGIGAAVATFSVVNGVLLRSLPYAEPERLVRIWSTDRRAPGGPTGGSVSPVVFQDWQERSTSFESMAALAGAAPTLTGLGEPEVLTGAQVTPQLFEVFGRNPVLGRTFTDEEMQPNGPPVVIVSHAFWRDRLGGGTDAVGRSLELNGVDREIVGVAPAGFEFPTNARIWLPLRNNPANCGRGCVYTNVIARLGPDVSLERAQQDMTAVSDRLSQEFANNLANRTAFLESLQATMVGDVRRALWLLLGAVGLVLLIACANVANLLIARATGRSDEIAVRTALGAGRGRIVTQLLTESLMLGLAGGTIGLGLSVWGVRLLRTLSADGIPRIHEVGLDGRVMLFAATTAIATTLLFGLAPALQLARTSIAGVLRQDAVRTAGGRRGFGRSALLAVEVGLSLLLLVGAGLLARSFATMQRIDPGFALDDITRFSISLPGAVYSSPDHSDVFFDELQTRLEAMPGVTAVGRTLYAPLSGNEYTSSFARTDRPPPAPGESPSSTMFVIDHRLFDALNIPVLEGRGFEATDRDGSTRVIIINRRFADLHFPGENAIGKSIRIGVSLGRSEQEPRTIIGITGDVRTVDLTVEPGPTFYVPYAQSGPGFATFMIRSVQPHGAILQQARSIVGQLDADLPIRNAGTGHELLSEQTARSRFYLFLFTVFAGLALALAAVGLYGVVAYLVAQRRREIGVRIVLGANAPRIVGLVLRQGLTPAVFGALGGLALALVGVRIMESLLFGIQPVDTLTFAATTALLLGVVVLACLIPALRATRFPPALALRAEQ